MNMGTVTNKRELSLQAKRIVKTIDDFLKNLPTEEEIRKDYFEAENLLALISNIRRVKKELETDRFVVIICGGLKSGKSTLINLLCHKEVSPTRLGRETTIRPCVFSDGDVSRVLLFYGIAESETRRKELFHAIIDYIKGIIDSKELKDIGLEIEEEPISEAVYWLTEENKMGSRSPIFVNVQIGRRDLGGKYNLLNEKILFIDTPGVDGITAGIGGRRDKENENLNVSWLAERVDLMLLLQSTVSPLNNSSINFIEKLYKDLNAPPIILIHNEFSLKCWRRDYKEMKEDSDADKFSIDNAKGLLRQKLEQTIESLRVNLGMAEDGFKFNRKELLKKSGFIDFEENLYKFIINNRRQIHEENVFNKLRRLKEKNLNPTFQKNEETDNIGYIRNRIKEEKEKMEEEKKKYLDILSDIKWIFNYEKCKVSSGIIEEYIETLKNIITDLKNELRNKEDLDKKIMDILQIEHSKNKFTLEEAVSKINNALENYRRQFVIDEIKNKLRLGEIDEVLDGKLEEELRKSRKKEESYTLSKLIQKFNNFEFVGIQIGKEKIEKLPKFHIEEKFIEEKFLNDLVKKWKITEEDIENEGYISKWFKYIPFANKIKKQKLSPFLRKLMKDRVFKDLDRIPEEARRKIQRKFDMYRFEINKRREEVERVFSNEILKDERERMKNTEQLLVEVENLLRRLRGDK